MTVSTQSKNENPNHLHYVDRRVVDNDFNVVRERPRNEKSMEIYGDARYNFAKTHRGSLVDGQLTIYSRYAQAVLAQFRICVVPQDANSRDTRLTTKSVINT